MESTSEKIPVLNEDRLSFRLKNWESNSNINNWWSYVKDIEDPHVRRVTALLLENQRLYREVADLNLDQKTNEVLYQLIVKVVPKLLIFKIGSVQPLLGPGGVVLTKYLRLKKDENDQITLKTLNGSNGSTFQVPEYCFNFEEDPVVSKVRNLKLSLSDDLDELAQKLIENFDNEHLKDLWLNVGSILKSKLEFSSPVPITSLNTAIIRKAMPYGRKCWIVVNRSTYLENKEQFDNINKYPNYYNSLHVVDHWNQAGVLMGSYGDEWYEREYTWCPYILFQPAHKDGKPTLLCRYGKKLRRNVAYGRIEAAPDETKLENA